MARIPRQDAPEATHHVMLRGIERRKLFRCDADREDFLARLEHVLEDGAGRCFAWALMDNHVHLLVRTESCSISRMMSRLNTGYAGAFNRRYDRVGHLFQNRFRSILVGDDSYLVTLLRYVHSNPLHGGDVGTLEQLALYPWSGHRALMGGPRHAFHAVDEVLGWFAGEPTSARPALLDLMRSPSTAGGGGPSLAPVRSIAKRRARRARHDAWTLDALSGWVCGEMDANVERVRRGERSHLESDARAVIAFLATRDLGFPLKEVSRATGVTHAPLSRAMERGARLVEERGLELPRSSGVDGG